MGFPISPIWKEKLGKLKRWEIAEVDVRMVSKTWNSSLTAMQLQETLQVSYFNMRSMKRKSLLPAETRLCLSARTSSYLEVESGVFEGSLHLSLLEPAQIAATGGRGAIGELSGDFLESSLSRFDVGAIMLDQLQRLFPRACHRPLHPTDGSTWVLVLYQNVTCL